MKRSQPIGVVRALDPVIGRDAGPVGQRRRRGALLHWRRPLRPRARDRHHWTAIQPVWNLTLKLGFTELLERGVDRATLETIVRQAPAAAWVRSGPVEGAELPGGRKRDPLRLTFGARRAPAGDALPDGGAAKRRKLSRPSEPIGSPELGRQQAQSVAGTAPPPRGGATVLYPIAALRVFLATARQPSRTVRSGTMTRPAAPARQIAALTARAERQAIRLARLETAASERAATFRLQSHDAPRSPKRTRALLVPGAARADRPGFAAAHQGPGVRRGRAEIAWPAATNAASAAFPFGAKPGSAATTVAGPTVPMHSPVVPPPAAQAATAAPPDTGRLVDEVLRRLDRRIRDERLRRGL